MQIKELKERSAAEKSNPILVKRYHTLKKLIEEMNARKIPVEIVSTINEKIEAVNIFSGNDKEVSRKLLTTKRSIFNLLQKKLKIVPKGFYQNLWMAVGMSAFGMPFGLILGLAVDNLGLLGLGIPFGMAIGIALGMSMDKKAAQEGRQLDIKA